MADKERQEDEMLRECLQDAYGYSDEELLKEMEEAENSLDDTGFAGAEERIYQRIMEKEAAEKTASEKTGDTGAAAGKKVKRIGKKKVLLAAALVAVFVGMLGVSSVGEKSYFFGIFRKTDKKMTVTNDRRNVKISELQEAYINIEDEFGISILKLNYLPSGMKFKNVQLDNDMAEICFDYNGNIIRCIQIKKSKETSIGIVSDRKPEQSVKNEWLNREIEYEKNVLNGKTEYESVILEENLFFFIAGQLPEDEFINIIKNINFY